MSTQDLLQLSHTLSAKVFSGSFFRYKCVSPDEFIMLNILTISAK